MAKSFVNIFAMLRSDLENAEKVSENNGMRGELDLMLAEAEIKHLRKNAAGFLFGPDSV